MKLKTAIITFLSTLCFLSNSVMTFAQSNADNELPDFNFCSIEATEIEENSIVQINWEYPYYWYYDDGEWDNILTFNQPGGECLVKFVNSGSTNTNIIGAEINVGDGTYPLGNDFLGKDFMFIVYDRNKLTGLPGQKISSVMVTVNNYDWVTIDDLNIEVQDSIFFIGVEILLETLLSPPVAYNTDDPKNFSYIKQPDSDRWTLFNNADLMIRAITCSGQSSDNKSYPDIIISRASDFDPTIGETPGDGVITILDSISEQTDYYTDNLFGQLTSGYYAYGLKKLNSDNSTYSDWYFSNNLLNTVGIDEFTSNDKMFTIFPNPANTEVTIKLSDKLLSGNTNIEVIDLSGKTVIKSTTSEKTASLNLGGLAKGYFIVKVWNNNYQHTESLVIK